MSKSVGAVKLLAQEMARAFADFFAAPAAVPARDLQALQQAADDWRGDSSAAAAINAAPLAGEMQAALDDFFQTFKTPEKELLRAPPRLWRELPWRVAGGGKGPPVVAVTELLGPNGMSGCARCRAGVFFQRGDSYYPRHKHAAAEFYLPLCGTAAWLADGRAPRRVAPFGELIYHKSWQAHAIRTDAEPLLALWLWTGDLDLSSYIMCERP